MDPRPLALASGEAAWPRARSLGGSLAGLTGETAGGHVPMYRQPFPLRSLFDVKGTRDGASLTPSQAELMQIHGRWLPATLGRPMVGGNRIELLVDGPQTYEAMFAAIANARDHINLESYILDGEGPGEALAELLLARRADGIQVNVIFDSFGSISTPSKYFERLRRAGVALCEYNPIRLWREPLKRALHLRDHRKLLIVDGRIAFTGGVNISSVYSAGSAHISAPKTAPKTAALPWRDTHLRIEGPAVEQLQQVFVSHWKIQTGRVPANARYHPALRPLGNQRVGVAACDAGRRRNPLYASVLAALKEARQSVSITTAYFVPPRRLLRALEAAARRGVNVRLMLSGISDSWVALAAARASYGRLLRAGVRIYERHDVFLHAKTMVVDGVWSTVGSSNMDWRSFLHNAEINVIALDSPLAGELDQLFEADVAAARPVALNDWSKRGAWHRVKELIGRRLQFFL